MRILVATDAWPPQVNGVVRTLQSLVATVRKLGAEIEFMTPEGFCTFPLPTDRSVRCAIPTWREIARRIELAAPVRCISPPKDQSGTLCGVIVSCEKFRLRPAT